MNNYNILLAGTAFLLPLLAEAKQRPNIIFILTDDHRCDALGYTGNPIIQTPAIDGLANEGVYFHKAFVTTPISAASRASLLTGLYERTHGYTFGTGDLKQSYAKNIYPALLKEQGYYTGFFGKLGVSIVDASDCFDEFDSYDRMDKYNDRRGYLYKTINSDTVHLTRYAGHQAAKFIEYAPTDKPFCLSISFSAPHAHDSSKEQYFWQEKSNSLYADVMIPPPLMADETHFMEQPQEVREGFNRVRWHWRYDTPEKYQHSMKGYYRMISEVDDEVANLRRLLKEKGIDNNTVIIFMGDNGLFTGERQLAGKWLMYEQSIHVPLIIFDPRANCHKDENNLVLNIDIPKTILSLAGIKVPKSYQGENLIPLLYTKQEKNIRQSFLIEHLWELPAIPSSEGIRTKDWKYFRYRFISAPEELYNLQDDPHETLNLASDPAYQAELNQLRKECDRQITSRLPSIQ